MLKEYLIYSFLALKQQNNENKSFNLAHHLKTEHAENQIFRVLFWKFLTAKNLLFGSNYFLVSIFFIIPIPGDLKSSYMWVEFLFTTDSVRQTFFNLILIKIGKII